MEHHSMSAGEFKDRYGVTPQEVQELWTKTVAGSRASFPNGDTVGRWTRSCAMWPWNCSRADCAGGRPMRTGRRWRFREHPARQSSG